MADLLVIFVLFLMIFRFLLWVSRKLYWLFKKDVEALDAEKDQKRRK